MPFHSETAFLFALQSTQESLFFSTFKISIKKYDFTRKPIAKN